MAYHYATPEELRLGMYVHLEGGWLAHPFPLSKFKITSPEQVATLRALGLEKIRWNPEKSDPPAIKPTPVAIVGSAVRRGESEGPTWPQSAPAQVSEQPAQQQRLAQLTAQRQALKLCERQFAEATSECKTLMSLVPTQPEAAREHSEALARALVSKMLEQGEVCIRLLTEAAGDHATLHPVNVSVISLLLGKALGMSETEMLDLGVGAVLHDVGKLDQPERVHHLADYFSASEIKYYQQHVELGVAHARKMGLSPGAAQVIAQHHEHVDGSGFPNRLQSDSITLASRIVSLVNQYDNLCNPSVPSKAMTPHEALALLFAQGKRKFDATILGGFIKMMGVYPPGSVVQLTDNRYAMVVSINSSRPLKPSVLVYERGVPRDEALVLSLETVPGLGVLRSIKPMALPREAYEYLSPRPRTAYFFERAQPLETETMS